MAQIQVAHKKLLFTSALNDYFLCENCGFEKQFFDKKSLAKHIKRCNKTTDLLPFSAEVEENAQVTSKLTKTRSSNTKLPYFCQVCRKNYTYVATLRYHIRQAHFNLISKTPYHQQKRVNQIWFENVQNSDAVIEIHKTGVNSLVLRRLSKNTAIKVDDVNTNTVDLSDMYPTFYRKEKVKCDRCKCSCYPHLLSKHKLKHHPEGESRKT